MPTLKAIPLAHRTHSLHQSARIQRISKHKQSYAAELMLTRGRVFAEEGSTAYRTYEIKSGALLMSRLTRNGERHILGILGSGDVIGRALSPIYDCTIESVTWTVLCRLDDYLEDDSEANMHFVIRHMQRQLMACRDHAVRLQSGSAETKLASLLLSLRTGGSGRGLVTKCPSSNKCIYLRVADISDCLSLSLETVSRILARFRRMGLISKPANGFLEIFDIERLSQLADPD